MELIKIENKDGKETVNARELWEFLEVKSRFNDWINNRIKTYGFTENQDYVSSTRNLVSGGQVTNFHISIDMAKELSMVERNDKGRKIRQWFIDRDNRLKILELNLPQTFSEALQLAANQAKQLEAAAPKIQFHDATAKSPDLQTVAEFANTLNKRNIKIGEKRLFKWFYENKYLIYHNRPYQIALDAGYFEVSQIEGTDYRNRPRMYNKVFITGKGRIFFTKKIIADFCPSITDNLQMEVQA